MDGEINNATNLKTISKTISKGKKKKTLLLWPCCIFPWNKRKPLSVWAPDILEMMCMSLDKGKHCRHLNVKIWCCDKVVFYNFLTLSFIDSSSHKDRKKAQRHIHLGLTLERSSLAVIHWTHSSRDLESARGNCDLRPAMPATTLFFSHSSN